MAKKHIVIKIYDDDAVEILKDDGSPAEQQERDVSIKKGKKVGQAFWVNENPTCVFYNGRWY
jgi:hypothetical protein